MRTGTTWFGRRNFWSTELGWNYSVNWFPSEIRSTDIRSDWQWSWLTYFFIWGAKKNFSWDNSWCNPIKRIPMFRITFSIWINLRQLFDLLSLSFISYAKICWLNLELLFGEQNVSQFYNHFLLFAVRQSSWLQIIHFLIGFTLNKTTFWKTYFLLWRCSSKSAPQFFIKIFELFH